jgi:hypothetical protein
LRQGRLECINERLGQFMGMVETDRIVDLQALGSFARRGM